MKDDNLEKNNRGITILDQNIFIEIYIGDIYLSKLFSKECKYSII
jgi:hypothetical protein